MPKTHNFDDYFIFKCLLLGVNLLFEKIEIIEIPLAAVSKTPKKHKKTEKSKILKKVMFFVKIRTKSENKKLKFEVFDSRECLTAV